MRLNLTAIAIVMVAGNLAATPVRAGLYQDDLSRCLLSSAKPEDRDGLLRWIFAAMASNPKIKDMANVSPDQAQLLSRSAAQLMQRLMLTDCRKQTVDAIRYEGAGAIQNAFGTLGQIAMADMMRDDGTATYMSQLDAYLDKQRWEELGKEAGIRSPVTKP